MSLFERFIYSLKKQVKRIGSANPELFSGLFKYEKYKSNVLKEYR